MSDKADVILTPEDLDTIGEIMNISMGSAATAVSTMLEKQVNITTPSLTQDEFGNIDCSNLEPALIVKIKYVEGLTGTNVIMLRRRDIQIILNILMGNEFMDESEDFEFDDMSMSAACEVMNQMMGSSATALSEILGVSVNISTPEATLVETKAEIQDAFCDLDNKERVVAISFKMMIKDIVNTTFSCFLPTELALSMVKVVSGDTSDNEEIIPEPQQQPTAMSAQADQPVGAAAMTPPPTVSQQPAVTPSAPLAAQQQFQPTQIAQPPMQQVSPQSFEDSMQNYTQPQQGYAQPQQPYAALQDPTAYVPQQFQPQPNQAGERTPMQFGTQPIQQGQQMQGQQMQGQQMQGQQMPGQWGGQQSPYQQMPYGVPPYGYNPYMQPPVGVQTPEFPNFGKTGFGQAGTSNFSMGLLMGVQLDVSVVIGKAKRKIKDIMDFGQGTVIELDKQTGAPAEIMVNGQLLAYGDVIVVGDNFGVRITEIVGTKELLDSLEKK